MNKLITAVLHLVTRDAKSVYELSSRVFHALYANITLFPTPEPTKEVFQQHMEGLNTLIETNDGSALMREKISMQTSVMLADLKTAQAYVNKIAQGEKIIILSSGFDCNNERVPTTQPPGKAVIRRITDGSSACSMKIYAETLEGADRYKVEACDSLINPVWIMLTDYVSFNKMEVKNLTRGKEIFVRISGGNLCGWGDPSDPISFIPR